MLLLTAIVLNGMMRETVANLPTRPGPRLWLQEPGQGSASPTSLGMKGCWRDGSPLSLPQLSSCSVSLPPACPPSPSPSPTLPHFPLACLLALLLPSSLSPTSLPPSSFPVLSLPISFAADHPDVQVGAFDRPPPWAAAPVGGTQRDAGPQTRSNGDVLRKGENPSLAPRQPWLFIPSASTSRFSSGMLAPQLPLPPFTLSRTCAPPSCAISCPSRLPPIRFRSSLPPSPSPSRGRLADLSVPSSAALCSPVPQNSPHRLHWRPRHHLHRHDRSFWGASPRRGSVALPTPPCPAPLGLPSVYFLSALHDPPLPSWSVLQYFFPPPRSSTP